MGLTLPALPVIGIVGCATPNESSEENQSPKTLEDPIKPVVLSTWSFGFKANEKAWETLVAGGRALDAVESGVQVPESDASVTSVGYGGLPDRDGNVTLDSCIMDETGNAGSVAFLQGIKNGTKL